MTEQAPDRVCGGCGHAVHEADECVASVGYDHLNGFHECGCPVDVAQLRAVAAEFETGSSSLAVRGIISARAERDALRAENERLRERIEATIRLLLPDEMTPTAARILRAALGEDQ